MIYNDISLYIPIYPYISLYIIYVLHPLHPLHPLQGGDGWEGSPQGITPFTPLAEGGLCRHHPFPWRAGPASRDRFQEDLGRPKAVPMGFPGYINI